MTESFVPKNKFPEALKEPLFKMALEAVKTGDYEESFFPTLTTVLPYNKFTLTVRSHVEVTIKANSIHLHRNSSSATFYRDDWN